MIALRPFVRPLALWLLVVFAAGCYSYVPVERPSPGTVVRIQVPLSSAVSDPNRPPETFDLEGTVLSSSDSLVLATETRRELGTFRVLTESDTLRVARSGLVSVEQQVFSKPKTIGLSLLIAAGVAGVLLAALEAAGGQQGEGPGGGGPQTAIRVPPFVLGSLLGAVFR